jgi:predicted nucleotidyltransferase
METTELKNEDEPVQKGTLLYKPKTSVSWFIMKKRLKGSGFSTDLLDRALKRERERREKERREQLEKVFSVLEELAGHVNFTEAYIFGSLVKSYRYFPHSDVDLAFLGLKDEAFFPAIAYLSRKLGREVDLVQLESHPLKEKILKEGLRWKRSG